MDLARLRLLLVAWWCATALPGLAVAVFFWDEAGDGAGAAFAVLAWVAGYVVQLLLFAAVGRHVPMVGTSALLWVPVSLLPWAIDWGPALGWAAETAFVLLAVVIALCVLYRASGSSPTGDDAVLAPAAPAAPSAPKAWRFTSWHAPGASLEGPRSSPARRAKYAPYAPRASGKVGSPERDLAGSLAALARLHEQGELTDGEFTQAARALLDDEDSAPPE